MLNRVWAENHRTSFGRQYPFSDAATRLFEIADGQIDQLGGNCIVGNLARVLVVFRITRFRLSMALVV